MPEAPDDARLQLLPSFLAPANQDPMTLSFVPGGRCHTSPISQDSISMQYYAIVCITLSHVQITKRRALDGCCTIGSLHSAQAIPYGLLQNRGQKTEICSLSSKIATELLGLTRDSVS